jgi:hypothetical protein
LFHNATERDKLHIDRSGFGTWVEVAGFLSKRFRELWNQGAGSSHLNVESGPERCEANFRTARQEVIDMLLSRDLINIHRKANSFRNNYRGHSGVVSEDITRSLLAELGELLAGVRSGFGETWTEYNLVSATDRSVRTEERYEVVVNHLHGATVPFPRETLSVASQLKRDSLYLIDRDFGDGLELLPFVAIHDVSQPSAACYFYNRKHSAGYRYISYHFENKPEVISGAKELNQLFKDLLE